jgi:hypothetical protein
VIVVVGLFVVVVVVVLEVVLLQELKTDVVTSSNVAATMSHFLLNLFNNSYFSFLLFPSL